MKHIANIFTGFRILGSISLLFFPVLSAEFYIIYILCGLSDMIDGAIARKTHSNSEMGAKMDSIADLVFVIASSIKLFPIIHIPQWLWIWGGVIVIIKIGNIIWGYFLKKQFISLHTFMNKAIVLLLFLLPFTISLVELKYIALAACFVATIAAIQEGIYIITDNI